MKKHPRSIGPARALDFAYAGCRTFDDLLEWPEDQKPKLAHAHKVGLKYREVRVKLASSRHCIY